MRDELREIHTRLEELYDEAVDSEQSDKVVSYLDDSISYLDEAIRHLI